MIICSRQNYHSSVKVKLGSLMFMRRMFKMRERLLILLSLNVVVQQKGSAQAEAIETDLKAKLASGCIFIAPHHLETVAKRRSLHFISEKKNLMRGGKRNFIRRIFYANSNVWKKVRAKKSRRESSISAVASRNRYSHSHKFQ